MTSLSEADSFEKRSDIYAKLAITGSFGSLSTLIVLDSVQYGLTKIVEGILIAMALIIIGYIFYNYDLIINKVDSIYSQREDPNLKTSLLDDETILEYFYRIISVIFIASAAEFLYKIYSLQTSKLLVSVIFIPITIIFLFTGLIIIEVPRKSTDEKLFIGVCLVLYILNVVVWTYIN